MGGPADILVWEGPAGPRVALTQHALAHEVDAPHDEEREDDADDGPDGTAVGWGVVGGRLGDFCQSTDRKRWSALPTKGRVPVGRYRGPWGGWLCPGRREALGCWGWAAPLTSGPPAHCPLGLPGAPSSSGSKLRLHPNGPSRAPSPQEPHTPPPLPGGSQWWLEAQTPEASVSHEPG